MPLTDLKYTVLGAFFTVHNVLIFQTVSLFTYIHTFKNRVDYTPNVRLNTFLTVNLFIYMIFSALSGVFRGNVHGTPDLKISTLQRYIEALGGHLIIGAVLPGGKQVSFTL